jgi:3-deoxy-D-manno-octulosonate 8-phosphate phosphatase KdsC-like HAD superfamily phosphatase
MRAAGGHGVVREVVEAILRSRGDWNDILTRYFSEQTAGAAT